MAKTTKREKLGGQMRLEIKMKEDEETQIEQVGKYQSLPLFNPMTNYKTKQ